MIYLDTHAAILLAQGDASRFSRTGLHVLGREDVVLSPAALLELETLHEAGRLKVHAREVVEILRASLGLRVCDLPFSTVVDKALDETWTSDQFDRLIVANARLRQARLLTRDQRIAAHYRHACW
ncbi:MAG: transposase [Candidatus Solibacter sp.]|nr:transposase [Candidatus Solibacter sp.]